MTYNHYYHFVIHESAFHQKLESRLSISDCSKWYGNEHVHIHLVARTDKPIKNNMWIRSEEMKDAKKPIEIYRHYFIPGEHDFFCNVTFNVETLKYVCMKSFLRNLNYLHDMEKLKLPRRLVRDIFRQSKSRFRLFEFHSQDVTVNYTDIIQFFTKQDVIWPKKLVVWFQNDVSFNYDFEEHVSRFVIVTFEFITADNNCVEMCLKCMNFENENGYYKRKYTLKLKIHISEFIMDPMHWCRACQQVPLFQLLSCSEFEYLYPYSIIDYFCKDTCAYPVIKMDYFENGVKVKCKYVFSDTSFGGNNNPYII